MKTTITFHVSEGDKAKIKNAANALRLSYSSYCRFIILEKLLSIKIRGTKRNNLSDYKNSA